MKLIFEAIKALFRKVENSISVNVAALSKRLTTTDANIKSVRTLANQAKNAANSAQKPPITHRLRRIMLWRKQTPQILLRMRL